MGHHLPHQIWVSTAGGQVRDHDLHRSLSLHGVEFLYHLLGQPGQVDGLDMQGSTVQVAKREKPVDELPNAVGVVPDLVEVRFHLVREVLIMFSQEDA